MTTPFGAVKILGFSGRKVVLMFLLEGDGQKVTKVFGKFKINFFFVVTLNLITIIQNTSV